MKAQQARTQLSSFKDKMAQFNEEVNGYKYQKKKEEYTTRGHDFDEHQTTEETDLQSEGIISTVYKFGRWVFSMILRLFWS